MGRCSARRNSTQQVQRQILKQIPESDGDGHRRGMSASILRHRRTQAWIDCLAEKESKAHGCKGTEKRKPRHQQSPHGIMLAHSVNAGIDMRSPYIFHVTPFVATVKKDIPNCWK